MEDQDVPVSYLFNTGMDGVFVENGIFRMKDDGSLVENPFSWNHNAHMLYLDQPVGTGFSFGDEKVIK
jgi:carboxypeptidase C (cathepsin A)